ncbi:MAG: FAD-dependent thymidylate synthase [Alphaproteobacteria bacterium]|nr:FAD-dependent thymidylate synthase [Alphaproteobacteria bacterium]
MKIVKPEIKPLTNINGEEALMLIQKVAKTCYQTEKTTDDIESAKRIVRSLIASGHHSMLEFYNITMRYVSNIAAYKDLRTHRHSTFAVESTRWCSYNKGKFDGQIKFLEPVEIPKDSLKYQVWLNGCQQAEKNYMDMISLGAKPDEASLLLPQSTAAEFNVTANLREWRHILNLRACNATGHARPCINEIMIPTLRLFAKEIPVVFDDLLEKLNERSR